MIPTASRLDRLLAALLLYAMSCAARLPAQDSTLIPAPFVDTIPAITVEAGAALGHYWLLRDSLPGMLVCAYGDIERDPTTHLRVPVILRVSLAHACGGWKDGILGALVLIDPDRYTEEDVKLKMLQVLERRVDWVLTGAVHGVLPYRDPEHPEPLRLLGAVWGAFRAGAPPRPGRQGG